MSVTADTVKQAVSKAIKGMMVDSKYYDEPVTLGQAVVTHYYLGQINQQKNHSSQH